METEYILGHNNPNPSEIRKIQTNLKISLHQQQWFSQSFALNLQIKWQPYDQIQPSSSS